MLASSSSRVFVRLLLDLGSGTRTKREKKEGQLDWGCKGRSYFEGLEL